MIETNVKKDREVTKVEVVRDHLRLNIVNGVYCPGNRLPTFVEMVDEFAVGRDVLQRALASLKRDGFIRSVNRRGLFVVPNPPHLHQYGIVTAASPGGPGWNQLMTAMSNESHQIEKNDPHARFRFYYDIQEKETYSAALAQLREDILAHRLAGLFLTPHTFHIFEHPSLKDLRVPRVYLWAADEVGRTPRVGTDGTQLIVRALHYLHDQGRRRIAILHMIDTSSTIPHQALYKEAGLEYHAPWIQHVVRTHPELAQELISLLMDARIDVRPDGLIIADDNLVEPVSRGLINQGIKVGQDLEIVAHCNWPWPIQSVLPMTRIGFDISEILRSAMSAITLQREGKTPLESHQVRAQFEHEVPLKTASSYT